MTVEFLPTGPNKFKKRKLRSPGEYLRSRQSIPTVEQISNQLEHSKAVEGIALSLEIEPKVQEKLQKSVQEIFNEHGVNMFNQLVSPQLMQAIQLGTITVSVDKSGSQNEITVSPEGNIQEKVRLSLTATQDLYSSLS